jgi:ribosome modulation factor
MPRPYAKTTYDGRTVDWLTRAALEDTAHRLGYDLTLHQGSYNAGAVKASAGTHDGGGAVDLAPWDHERKVLELRRTGFAAWYRPASRSWSPHIHAVLIGNRKLSPGAADQVRQYLAGYDGLAGRGRDTGPRQFVDNRYRWKRGAVRVHNARKAVDRALHLLRAYAPGRPGVRGIPVGKSRRLLREAAKQLPKE